MCDPFVAGALGVGTILQAVGSIQQGRSANQAAQYNAQQAENQAVIRDRQAADALVRGNIEEQRFRLGAGQERGTQAARLAAQGVEVSSGSPLQVLGDQAGTDELDALTIRGNAAQEAYGFEVDANDLRNQATLSRRSGRSAQTAGYLSAGGSLLTGAGRVSSIWTPTTAASVPSTS